MKSKTLKSTFLAITLFGLILSSNAQKNYELTSKQKFTAIGTSSMHDWEMESNSGKGTANFKITDFILEKINAITITILSESLKSGKSAMDRIAYKTLQTDDFKTITYVMKTAEKVDETTWNLKGTYTIAGVSKELKTKIKTTVTDGTITIQGSNKITFDEFGMKAPKALFGTIKTGQEITIQFDINFN